MISFSSSVLGSVHLTCIISIHAYTIAFDPGRKTNLDRHDLLLELALPLRLGSLLKALCRKRILHVPRDPILLGDILTRDTHRDQTIGRLGIRQHRVRHALRHDAGAIVRRHVLDTGREANIDFTGFDFVGDLGDGGEARGALAVDRVDGDSIWLVYEY